VSVARAYATRPPYPAALFPALAQLMARTPRVVLELGCGSGDLTYRLAPLVDRIDAIDPSEAMLEIALARRTSPNICLVQAAAESFVPQHKYALAVAAESLHWMDWSLVLPKLSRCLGHGGLLAIVPRRVLRGLPWLAELEPLIARHSTNQEYQRAERAADRRPANTWHRFESPRPVKVLTVTPQPTEHSTDWPQ
jgi:trans-aconitate methyltransferase